MRAYRIKWETDLEAASPEEAARAARAIHQRPHNIANVFEVKDKETHEGWEIDLEELGESREYTVIFLDAGKFSPSPNTHIIIVEASSARNAERLAKSEAYRSTGKSQDTAEDFLCLSVLAGNHINIMGRNDL